MGYIGAMPKRKERSQPRINIRVTEHLRTQLDSLAARSHLRLSDFVRVQLEEIAEKARLAATGGQP